LKAKKEVRVGVLPTYLVNRKKQAEIDERKMKMSIELNKRPQGTIRLTTDEIVDMRSSLFSEKQKLSTQIEKVPISQYTVRAKAENKHLVKKLDEVDKAITVFERDNVFIKK
jgi:hypothetical protein